MVILSSWEGGGSTFDTKLLNDLTINIGQIGKTKYDKLEIILDGSQQYSIDDTFGVTNSFYGQEIIVNK